uniref:Putative virion glycoprotein N-terminal domain-containing protein n=1 Tax=Aphis glycines virus 3 isolate 1 TaxID=2961858 RepID=A0A976RXG5_9VIRU|nr:hypothetical protein 1 [Aphis glycines virus 3 isolate 1]
MKTLRRSMLRMTTIITLVMVVCPTYEKPLQMNTILLPQLIHYIDNNKLPPLDLVRLNKFVDYIVKTIYVERDNTIITYHSPHKTDMCVKVLEATIMTDIECSLPSHCGKLYIHDEKLTWFENKKLCVGTGVCKRQGQLGCSNGYKLLKVRRTADASPNYVYDNDVIGRVDVTSVDKFVIMIDIYTNYYYLVASMCLPYLYTSTHYDVILPKSFHSSSNVDEYCMYDVAAMCQFIGPFKDEYTALRSMPITVDVVVQFDREPTAIDQVVCYDQSHLLQLSRHGPTAVITGFPNIEVVCYKTEYIKFSVAAIFEKQLNHIASFVASCSHNVENFIIKLFERMLDYLKHHFRMIYIYMKLELSSVYNYLRDELVIGIGYVWEYMKSVVNIILTPTSHLLFKSPYFESIVTCVILITYGYSIIRSIAMTVIVLMFVLFCFEYN